MFKKLAFLLLLLPGLHAVAQKVEVKNNVILLDGQPYAGIEGDGCGFVDPQCQYYLTPVGSEKRLFVVKQVIFEDPMERKESNPTGRTLYLQFVFTAAGTTDEIPFPATLRLRALDVARKVAKARLFQNGVFDEQAAADFVTNNGTPFGDRRRALNAPPTIILNAPGRY